MAHEMLRVSGVLDRLSDTDVLACLTAALCHDLDHPGVNNDFLINSKVSPRIRIAFGVLLVLPHSLRGLWRNLTGCNSRFVPDALHGHPTRSSLQDPLALLYNDFSVLENHHLCATSPLFPFNETCPISTRGRTRRVQSVREGEGGRHA